MKASADLNDAFKVIAEYDPDTYAAMVASDWTVSTNPGDVHPKLAAYGIVTGAYGVTSGIQRRIRAPQTFIGTGSIREWAEQNGQPAVWLTADVLVHEFVHAGQPSVPDSPDIEAPAFTAGTAFARALPARYGRALARESELSRVSESAHLRAMS